MNKRTRERERRAEKLGLFGAMRGADTRTPEQRAADAERKLQAWAARRMEQQAQA